MPRSETISGASSTCVYSTIPARWPNMAYNWRDNLQKRVAAGEELKNALLDSNSDALYKVISDDTLRTLVDVVEQTAPASGKPSQSSSWLSEQLEPLLKVVIWRPMSWPVLPEHLIESFHLHCRILVYYGLQSERLSPTLRLNARVAVYFRINYREESNYGPFIPDWSWRVNWFALDQVVIVILMNIEESVVTLPPDFHPPKGLDATRPGFWKSQGDDWAGVTGKWRHVRLLASGEAQSC
jgi:hypothetical protein